MRKYWFLCFAISLMCAFFILGVYVCPDFMFLQSYRPNFDNLDYIAGAYVIVVGYSFVFSLFLFSFLIWDFFKHKSSDKKSDENKNESKE